MAVAVHDIVYLKSMENIEIFETLPQWMLEDEMAQGVAVVRRMKVVEDKVAIGFRGNNRSKRFAAITPKDNIARVIRPADVIHQLPPKTHEQIIHQLATLLKGQRWGIGGSLGFTMATGITVCHEKSDIDLILYCEKIQEVEKFYQLPSQLLACRHKVDIQVEIIGVGAFVLEDYINHDEFLLRTSTGPLLLKKSNMKGVFS